MFLLRSIDLIALVSLFLQTFVAWIFVAILTAVRTDGRRSAAFRAFLGAFGALALALTFVSIRFARTHDEVDRSLWFDGGVRATSCYVGYLAAKALFAWQLLRGAAAIAGAPSWPPLTAAVVPLVALHAALPLAIRDVHGLLLAQAPLLVAVGGFGFLLLRGASGAGSGRRLVRVAFAALAVTWVLYPVAVLLQPHIPAVRYLLACNSLLDLAVQMVLGAGVLLCVLEEAHQRARAAEQERERLQRTLARDERLRALGTLVSGVAHELNNPLTVILGHCDLLPGGDAADSPARIVAEQAQRCRGIVRDLSALSGQVRRHRDALDAREVAGRIVRGIAAAHCAGGQRVEVEVAAGLAFHADRIGIEQVLTNLVVNALQASPPGGVVHLRASASAAGGVEWEVEDEGAGIPDEIGDRLFEPFFTTKRPGEGTGLGLSIAQAIVGAHGGTIVVGSGARGRGANCRVTLPAVDPAADAAPGGKVESAPAPR
ncbi:MAG: HAMP domain-containing histidine kinase [Planctomycetes bacterium]|nr:HAMP domain-containing histidine kinase [Planctomycetota bacterium]